MLPKKTIDQFEIHNKKNGKNHRVVFRLPKLSDAYQAKINLDNLIDENALISIVKKKTLAEEKEWIKGMLRDIKSKKCVSLMVKVDGKLIGGAGVDSKKEGLSHIGIIGIALQKEARGLGIGTRLLNKVMELAKQELKTEIIELHYFKGNPAVSLYKRLGFKEVGVFPDMRKRIFKGRLAGKNKIQYHDQVIMYKRI